MQHELRVALCHTITRRAHLAGAQAAELDAEAGELMALAGQLLDRSEDSRRRYWREVAAVQTLMGQPWPEAEALGVEPC
jgi:hypothetical protein